jgi:glutamyl-tRNA synthetase
MEIAMFITRVAPSPTGDFHLGTARTAYFNWLAARATGGRFLLRIDDTDTARNDPASVGVIHDSMDWLGLDYDDTFTQSRRLDRYRAVADDLVARGQAEVAWNGGILLKDAKATAWHDMVSGDMTPSDDSMDLAAGQVIVKSDGMPVYHFASVVDDIDSGVNLVIRGKDHMTNTFRHTAIYHALGAPLPTFAHVGLITLGKKKMSKRDSAASLLGYRDDGISPDAVLNFVLRMGWGPSIDDKTTALLPRDRALALFLDGGRMRAAPSAFDAQRLASLDRKYKAIARNAAA